MNLNPITNPSHARIAGWLNIWPDYVVHNPLPSGLNLYPLEQALRMAGDELRPRRTWFEDLLEMASHRN